MAVHRRLDNLLLDHERRAQRRVAGKRNLRLRRENAHVVTAVARLAGQQKGALREVHLLGEPLHVFAGKRSRLGEHGKLVAGVFLFREYVHNEERDGGHVVDSGRE